MDNTTLPAIMSQQEAFDHFMPAIKAGKVYDKFAIVQARPAISGERIVTITGDGKETENTAVDGDYVVENSTSAKEQYILAGSKLAKRYALLSKGVNGWNTYKATGSCQAAVYDGPNIKFIATWGEEMSLKTGDMICTPLPNGGEVYRIAAKEFSETYAERK